MQKPRVFVIILNYNGKDFLKKCLESVYLDDYPNKEVVVVDNNSQDNSFDEARVAYARFHFIKNTKNIGFSAGNNVAIRWAIEKKADFVFLLNNDALLGKGAIKNLVDEMQNNPELGMVSPLIYFGKSKKIWFSGGRINWLKMRVEHRNSQLNTDYITGCAMMIRESVFRKIGLLDEKYFLYYEDADFSYRAKLNGFGLKVIKTAEVYHFEKSSENINKIYYLVLSAIIFFRKNSNSIIRFYIEALLFLRRIKNRADLRKEPNDKLKILVKKAFVDADDIKL